jgi:hypothetical protein
MRNELVVHGESGDSFDSTALFEYFDSNNLNNPNTYYEYQETSNFNHLYFQGSIDVAHSNYQVSFPTTSHTHPPQSCVNPLDTLLSPKFVRSPPETPPEPSLEPSPSELLHISTPDGSGQSLGQLEDNLWLILPGECAGQLLANQGAAQAFSPSDTDISGWTNQSSTTTGSLESTRWRNITPKNSSMANSTSHATSPGSPPSGQKQRQAK